MPISEKIVQQLKAGTFSDEELNLSKIKLTDSEFLPLIKLLPLNKQIKSLNLRKNQLTGESWKMLAKNTTLTTIALTGNPEISVLHLKPFEANTTLQRIVGALGGALKKQLQKNSIQPTASTVNPGTISQEPLHKSRRTPVAKTIDTQPKDSFITKDQQALAAITDGEISVQQLIHCFLFDLSDFNTNIEFVIWYIAVALNCYMHNASHSPLSDYSSVQDREKKAKLYYSRSQNNHPIARRNDAFVKPKVAEEQGVGRGALRSRGVGVLNNAMVKLFSSTVGDNIPVKPNKRRELIANLKNIDNDHGFPKKGVEIKAYFSLALAHGGLRTNNIAATETILRRAIQGEASPEDKLSELLIDFGAAKLLRPVTRKVQQLSTEIVTARISAYHTKFQQLSSELALIEPNLQSRVLTFKQSRNDYLCREFTAWLVDKDKDKKHIKLESYGSGCLLIDINPQLLKIPDGLSETKKQNITEILIGFLVGIINHQVAINNISLWVERRQSFGFNLSTLTDIGSFKIRLSHGLEPQLFDNILLESFKLFYTAIQQKNAFNPELVGMRSVDKQWRAGFEAQYYLERAMQRSQNNYASRAFTRYVEKFGVQDKFMIAEPLDSQNNVIKYPRRTISLSDVVEQSLLFDMLGNTLSYAVGVGCFLDVKQTNLPLQFRQSYYHIQGKLYLHCLNAQHLLTSISNGSADPSQVFKDANKLLENIVEYTVLLDNLHAIQAKELNRYQDPTIELCQTEKQFVVKNFEVKASNIDVYFTDSGQQAIVLTLLALDLNLLLSGVQKSQVGANFYNFGNNYFEVTSFIKDIGWSLAANKNKATLTLIDITKLDEFLFNEFNNLMFIVVDVTHQPLFTDKLKQVIAKAQRKNIVTVLVSSCLKHDELGLDKYTAGKITVIRPPKISLQSEAVALFHAVSEYGNTHAVRSYLQMANTVCGDKIVVASPIPRLSVSGGIFSAPKRVPSRVHQNTPTPDNTNMNVP